MNASDTFLSNIKKNQISIMKYRGYEISDGDQAILDASPEDVWMMTKGYADMDKTYVKIVPEGENILTKVYYKWKMTSYVKVDALDDVLKSISRGLRSVLLVVNAKLSPTAQASLTQMTNCKTQIWLHDDLILNPMEHVSCPHNRLLTGEDEIEVIKALTPCSGAVPTKAERSAAKERLNKIQVV